MKDKCLNRMENLVSSNNTFFFHCLRLVDPSFVIEALINLACTVTQWPSAIGFWLPLKIGVPALLQLCKHIVAVAPKGLLTKGGKRSQWGLPCYTSHCCASIFLAITMLIKSRLIVQIIAFPFYVLLLSFSNNTNFCFHFCEILWLKDSRTSFTFESQAYCVYCGASSSATVFVDFLWLSDWV